MEVVRGWAHRTSLATDGLRPGDSAMSKKYAVVGATGNVGREILQILAERGVAAKAVTAVASSRSIGMEVSYGEDDVLKVDALDDFDFSGVDIVLSSPGAKVSAEFALGGGGRGGCNRQQFSVQNGSRCASGCTGG